MTADREFATVESTEVALVVRFLTDSLLDPLVVECMSEQLHAAQVASVTGTMILTFAGVDQLSTLMLSVMVSLRDKAHEKGGDILLAALPDRVDYVLKLTQLDKAFPTHATVDDALQSLA